MKYLRRGSGYYIDVGAADLVANGDVKLAHGQVDHLTEDAVVLEDGTELPADLVVYATGYGSMNGWAADLISQEVADTVGKVWGLGSDTTKDPGPWEGEQRNMWKPTQQEALWFHGGNLHQSRHYSLYLALQLKARLEGIDTPVYGLQEVHHTADVPRRLRCEERQRRASKRRAASLRRDLRRAPRRRDGTRGPAADERADGLRRRRVPGFDAGRSVARGRGTYAGRRGRRPRRRPAGVRDRRRPAARPLVGQRGDHPRRAPARCRPPAACSRTHASCTPTPSAATPPARSPTRTACCSRRRASGVGTSSPRRASSRRAPGAARRRPATSSGCWPARADEPVTTTDVHANESGNLHGGVSMFLADLVAGALRPDLVTASVHIAYTRGIPIGAEPASAARPPATPAGRWPSSTSTAWSTAGSAPTARVVLHPPVLAESHPLSPLVPRSSGVQVEREVVTQQIAPRSGDRGAAEGDGGGVGGAGGVGPGDADGVTGVVGGDGLLEAGRTS